MKHLAHKKRFSRKGVSDIIGNLLILAITVTLFSSILYYVISMPTPEEKTYGDFSANLTYDNQSFSYPIVTIQHTGGKVLPNDGTFISISVDNVNHEFTIADSELSIGSSWETGESWIQNLTGLGITTTSKVDAMIVDHTTNSLVWSTVILDPSSRINPPVIMNKWFAGQIDSSLWISTDLLTQGQQAILFAKVYDVDADVANASADLRQLGGPANQILTDANHDGVWSGDPFTVSCAVGTWNAMIYASDMGGRHTSSQLSISVRSPTETNGGSHGGSGGGIGDAPINLMYSFFQGFNTFKYSEWDEDRYNATPTTYFAHDEDCVVVVASKFLVNTDGENTMLVIDPITKAIVNSVSSPTVQFVRYDYVSGYCVYNCTIDTGKLVDGKKYILQMQLKDTWIPNDVFYATQTITIGPAGFPVFETYSDPSYTTRCENFTTSSTVYVLVKDQSGGLWDQMGGDVQIMDFFWKTQLKRIPGLGADNPVSNVTKSGNSYTFSIDLSAAKQDPWVPGNSTYLLKYDVFKAGTEIYSLSKIINITAPKIILDVVTGCDGTQNNAWGSNVFIEFYSNEDQWAAPDYVEFTQEKTSITRVTEVKIADVNGDKKNDVLAVLGVGNGNTVSYYEINLYLNDGQWTKKTIVSALTDQPKSIELGNVDLDGDLDILVGFNSGEVGYYRNDGLWTYYHLSSGTSVDDIKFIDLDHATAYPYIATGLDVIIGRSAGGVTVCKNLNHIGTSWSTTTWTGGTTTMFFEQASSDIAVTGVVSGSYVDTKAATSHETIQEVGLPVQGTSLALQIDASSTSSGLVTYLALASDGQSVIIDGTKFTLVNLWQTPDAGAEPFTSVTLYAGWTTGSKYAPTSPDYIQWGMAGTPVGSLANAIKITQTSGSASFTLPGSSWTEDDLTHLEVYLKNGMTSTSNGGNDRKIYLDYLYIVATSAGGVMSVDHRWTVPSVPSGSQTFSVDAWAPTVGGDTFEFQYSVDGTNFASMSPFLIVSSSTKTTYTASLPIGAFSGTVYIRVVDTSRTIDTQSDSICLNNMFIKSAVTGSGSIGAVSGICVEDMNGDYYQDMIVADKQYAWVGINDLTGGVTALTLNIQKVVNSALTSIVGVAGGNFVGSDNTMDVLIATSSNGVYFVPQSSPGTFGAILGPYSVSGSITDFTYGDVDGDGKTDLLIAQTNKVILYLNHGTSFDSWRRYTVDVYTTKAGGAVPVNSISVGKVSTGV